VETKKSGWRGWNRGQENFPKPDITSTQKIVNGWDNIKNKIQEVADSFSEFINYISGKNDVEKRVDEALICSKQRNSKTGHAFIPPDIIILDSRGIGIIRPPSPSELSPNEVCVDVKLRSIDMGLLPGYEVPGKP